MGSCSLASLVSQISVMPRDIILDVRDAKNERSGSREAKAGQVLILHTELNIEKIILRRSCLIVNNRFLIHLPSIIAGRIKIY
jgi:hypothetical protein